MPLTLDPIVNYCPNNQGGSGEHEPIRATVDQDQVGIEAVVITDGVTGGGVHYVTKTSICRHCGAIYALSFAENPIDPGS